jgi:D-alanyl-D-alanine carboxypeptidase
MLAKGLQSGTFGATSLTGLKPYGATRDQVADVSKEICSKHGKKVRSESRDEAGRNKMASPYIHERLGEPAAELVAIVPAGKSVAGQTMVADLATGDGDVEPANVPIPQPRPLD